MNAIEKPGFPRGLGALPHLLTITNLLCGTAACPAATPSAPRLPRRPNRPRRTERPRSPPSTTRSLACALAIVAGD